MKTFFKFFGFTLLALVFISNISLIHVRAQTTKCVSGPNGYCPLVTLPGVTDATKSVDLNTYIPNVVKLIIALAGGLAVLRIIFGGIKYMTSEAFEGKSDARQVIDDAVIGLLLVISAYVILNTVNPALVNFDFSIAGLRAGAPIGTGLGTDPNSTTTPGEDTLGGNITVPNCPIKGGGVKPCTCINCANAKGDPTLTFKNGTTMNAALLKDVKTIRDNTPDTGWQVTEAWPPSSPHTSQVCHYNGTCIDINLTINKYESDKTPTVAQVSHIMDLAQAIRATGHSVIFEVNTTSYNLLKTAGVDESLLRDVSKSSAYQFNTAPSFHVN